MPWQEHGSGFTTKRGGHIVNPAQYERLRAKGMSKQKAAAITNSVNKAQWTDQQLKRRKQLSAGTSVAGSTIGLTALGASAVGSKIGGRGLKRLTRLAPQSRQPGLRQGLKTARRTAKKIQTPLLTAGAGIGGVGGLNYASIQSQEAKRPKPKPKLVVINTTRKKLPGQLSAFEKAYSSFDAERNRRRRNIGETAGLAAGGAAGIGVGGHQGVKALGAHQNLGLAREKQSGIARNLVKVNADYDKAKASRKKYSHIGEEVKRLRGEAGKAKQAVGGFTAARKTHSIKAGVLVGLGAAATGGAVGLNRNRNSPRGRSYGPRYRPRS